MKTETKIALGFAVVLICSTGLILSWIARNQMAKIEFSEARLETNGTLKINYDYTPPIGTFLLETHLENGSIRAEARGYGGGYSHSGPSKASTGYSFSIPNIPSPPPSMLVITRKTYYLKPHEKLPMYDFTNTSGTTYRGELSLNRPEAK